MLGQIYDYKVKNYKIRNRKESLFSRDFPIYCVALFLIFLLSIQLVYITGKIRQIDSSIARATKNVVLLEQQNNELKTRYQEITSMAKLEIYAKRTGLKPMDISQVRFVYSSELNSTNKILLALKQKKDDLNSKR